MKQHIEHSISSIFILLLFCFMLISPTAVFQGSEQGLVLWFRTILPTLLPFSILSNLLIETGSIFYLSNAVGPFLCPLFRVSSSGVFAIVVGFLCGYPLGAKVIGQLLKNQMISKEEGNYLLSFCNNVSPIFIINYIVQYTFKNEKLLFPVLIILMGCPVICSFIFRIPLHPMTNHLTITPSYHTKKISLKLLNTCMMDSFETMIFLGGYIIIFSILLQLINQISFFPFLSYLTPFLEVTNGIVKIQELPFPDSYQLLFTLSITSFGGFCSIAQTKYVLNGSGLSMKKYTIKKLITMLITSLLTFIYLLFI